MQTFFTYPSFEDTAKSLDNKRLGKQRVEAMQILKIVEWYETRKGPKPAWNRHPAVLQWVGYSEALRQYLQAMIDEWVHRGFNNTIQSGVTDIIAVMPWWTSCDRYTREVIRTHRARLMQKDSDYYFWENIETSGVDYYWPVRIDKKVGKVAEWNIDGSVIKYWEE